MSTKESDLGSNDVEPEYALHTLLHIIKLASKGDYKTILKLGLTEDDINQLLTLNMIELHDLATISKANFVKVGFDSIALNVALNINESKSKRRQQIKEMLKAGASHPVMSHFYGLTPEDISNFKKMLHIPSGEGRPSLPSESNEKIIWEIVKPADQIDNEMLPEFLLTAHKKTKVPISSIWPLLNKWFENNKKSGSSTHND